MPTFTNQATLSFNTGVANSNIVTGEIVQVLSASKTVLDSGYAPGGTVTYIVTLVNSGTAPYTGLTVTDDLGAYSFGTGTLSPLDFDGTVNYYVNGALQPEPAVTQGPPLVFSGISVPAGGNATLIYRATANSFAPLGTDAAVTNTATVTGGGLSSPLTASATLPSDTAPVLSIAKTLAPTTVSENGTLTYTFLIENRGGTAAEASDNLSVSDTFDPILNGLTVTLDGTALVSPADYTYDPATGVFTTVPGRITVPAAVYSEDVTTGQWSTAPGTATLQVTGTV